MAKTKKEKIVRWVIKKDPNGIVLGWEPVEEEVEMLDRPEVPSNSPGWVDTAPQA